MMITYRAATNNDLSYLCDLDLKCHEQSPADKAWWGQISENQQAGCVVACKSHVPIGMCVWERQAFKLPEFETKRETFHIHKICVRKEFRNQGIGRNQIAYVHEAAKKRSCAFISIAVPEYRCNKKEPDDVSEWLAKLNFQAKIILPTKVNLYGCEYDQYLFVFKVKYSG